MATEERPYEEQTELFKLIGRKDWKGALEKLKESPEEAKIWIVTKYRGGSLVDKSDELTIWYKRLPIHHACGMKSADVELIRALIDVYPESIMEKDETGKVPLIHAARRATAMEVLEAVLTEETAGTEDNEGKCALHWACEYKSSLAKVKLLTEKAPSVLKFRDCYGRVPLHWECSIVGERKDKMPVVEYLAGEYGAAVNIEDADGRSPLQMIDLSQVFALLQNIQSTLGGGGEDDEEGEA